MFLSNFLTVFSTCEKAEIHVRGSAERFQLVKGPSRPKPKRKQPINYQASCGSVDDSEPCTALPFADDDLHHYVREI